MPTPVDIIGGFYTVDGRSWAAQDCVNYLPTAAEVSGTKTQSMLKTPPGLRPYIEIGDGPAYAIRGGHDVEGRRFVVSGQMLYQISNAGVAIPIGTVPGVGRVSMAHNQIAGGNELLVVNGNAGYVWNTLKQTFTRITDQGYPGAFLADFVDGYLMQVEPFGRFLFPSDLVNASEYNTLDRFEAEAQPDPIVSMLVDHQEVWVFGGRTIQMFQNTGAAQGTFQSKGIVIEQGCAGRFTPAKLDNSVFWLGNDGIFYRADGYNPVRISTHAIEDAIADSDWSQAFAFVWSSKGHKVYYCTFPDGQTWGYDVSSRLWHRRASYHPVHEVARRWRLSDLFYSNGEWVGCDSTSGKMFILDWDYMFEGDGESLVSERTSQIAYASGSRFSVDMVDLIMRTGEEPSTPSAFKVQPRGPSISGDAPGATLGFQYPGFTYTVAAGDKPISSIRITNGELPPGLTLNTVTGAISATTPSAGGTFKITVRVTDENGLWDEVVDTIAVSPVFFLLFGSGTEGVWITADLDNWSPKFNFIPTTGNRVYNAEATQGKLAIDVMNVTSNWVEHFLQAPMPPWNVSVPVVDVLAPFTGITLQPHKMQDFAGTLLAWEENGNRPLYFVSVDGGSSYEEVAAPGGLRPRGFARLRNGRWLAYFSLASTRGLYYSDEAVPKQWIQSPGSFNNQSSQDCLAADQYGYFIDNLRRVYRTSDGIAWVHVNTLPSQPASPSPFVTSTGAVLIYGENANGKTHISHDHGTTFTEVTFAASGAITKVTEAGGYIIGSRNSAAFAVSTTDGDSWIEKTVPFSGYGTAATVIAVDATVPQ